VEGLEEVRCFWGGEGREKGGRREGVVQHLPPIHPGWVGGELSIIGTPGGLRKAADRRPPWGLENVANEILVASGSSSIFCTKKNKNCSLYTI